MKKLNILFIPELLRWNPHIHCLISEGGYSDDGFWRNISHFNYTYLRNAFRTALLNELESRLGPSLKKVKAKCYSEHKQGFYVYAKPNNPSLLHFNALCLRIRTIYLLTLYGLISTNLECILCSLLKTCFRIACCRTLLDCFHTCILSRTTLHVNLISRCTRYLLPLEHCLCR